MEEDMSFVIQKQIKDNTEDLQRELMDMKNWEQQARRKDEELLKIAKGQESLPPVRNTRQEPNAKSDKKQKKSRKGKKIKAHNHNACEKFAADTACKVLDKNVDSGGFAEESASQEQLEKYHEEAIKHKLQGNAFVQKQMWKKAIACYDDAIKLYPYDATFFANRALCYLKLDDLHSSEADCTAALMLDNDYIKVYHRRAVTRMGLKHYIGAKEDIIKVLKVIPRDKKALLALRIINDNICTPSSHTKIDDVKTKEVSLSKRAGEGTLIDSKISKKNSNTGTSEGIDAKNTKQINERDPRIPDWLPEKDNVAVVETIKKPPPLRSMEEMTRILVEEADFTTMKFDEPAPEKAYIEGARTEAFEVNAGTDFITMKLDESTTKKTFSEDPCRAAIKVITETDFPTMEFDESATEKASIEHPRTETFKVTAEPNFVTTKFDEPATKVTCTKDTRAQALKITAENKQKRKGMPEEDKVKTTCKDTVERKGDAVKTVNSVRTSQTNDVPKTLTIPKNAVQFMMNWRTNKSLAFRYAYLKQLPRMHLFKIFQESMEIDIISEIVNVLRSEFTEANDDIYSVLVDLSQIKRFRALIMFLSDTDKQVLRDLFNYCDWVQNIPKNEINALREAYEV